MKKKMMSLVAVGLAVSMLAGCGNAGTSGDESSGSALGLCLCCAFA